MYLPIKLSFRLKKICATVLVEYLESDETSGTPKWNTKFELCNFIFNFFYKNIIFALLDPQNNCFQKK